MAITTDKTEADILRELGAAALAAADEQARQERPKGPHGGRRDGAGRPIKRDSRSAKKAVSLPQSMWDEIHAAAEADDCKRSDIIYNRLQWYAKQRTTTTPDETTTTTQSAAQALADILKRQGYVVEGKL